MLPKYILLFDLLSGVGVENMEEKNSLKAFKKKLKKKNKHFKCKKRPKDCRRMTWQMLHFEIC